VAKHSGYQPTDFTPYLLNLAAEAASLKFQNYYKGRYGMLRTEWRVLFHLGHLGPMYAKDICARAHIHKTKVSRAVSALESKRYLMRGDGDADRRHALLELTKNGARVFKDLFGAAQGFDARLNAQFSDEERLILRKCLLKISGIKIE
jgi:DNA-binding MarR family transcriptional regulator